MSGTCPDVTVSEDFMGWNRYDRWYKSMERYLGVRDVMIMDYLIPAMNML